MTDKQPEARQVPLHELLEAIPEDIRIGVKGSDDWSAGTTWHPVGVMCHQAAAELRRLHEVETKYHESVGGFKRDLAEKLEQQRKKNTRLTDELRRLEKDYVARDVELRRLHEVNAELVEALRWLNLRGGLGLDVHEALRKLIAKATGKQTKDTPVWYFMRDNHTFRKLTGSVESMLTAITEEISAGYKSGSVFCRELKIDIHCDYKNTAAFTEECRAVITKATGEQQ